MKKLTIHYLPHSRLEYHELIYFFLNKIKDENKDKIIFNIYTNNIHYFNNSNIKLQNIDFNIIQTSPIYLHKIDMIKLNSTTEYSMKLDEDIFINNYIWDYMIENIDILDNKDNLIIAPLLSCGIPTSEYFINNYFNEQDKNTIYDSFLKFGFGISFNAPSNPWGYDVSFLNKLTINCTNWDGMLWLEEINNIPHHYKGYHPIRNGYEQHEVLNSLILNDVTKLIEKQNYSFIYLKNRYYTNSTFIIKTDTWINILNDKSLFRDDFDEVPLNLYMQQHNLNYLFVDNGFSIHTTYNTNYKPSDEYNFYNELKNKIIK